MLHEKPTIYKEKGAKKTNLIVEHNREINSLVGIVGQKS